MADLSVGTEAARRAKRIQERPWGHPCSGVPNPHDPNLLQAGAAHQASAARDRGVTAQRRVRAGGRAGLRRLWRSGQRARWAARRRLGRAAGGWMPPGPSRVRPPRPTRAPRRLGLLPDPSLLDHRSWPSSGSHGRRADELGRLGCLAKQRRLRPTAARSFLGPGGTAEVPRTMPWVLAAAIRERWRLPGGPGQRSESASAPPGTLGSYDRPGSLVGPVPAGHGRCRGGACPDAARAGVRCGRQRLPLRRRCGRS
jgi:hypothetical protein